MTSVIIVQHNHQDLTREAIRTFREHHPGNHEIILVDNASEGMDKSKIPSEVTLIRNDANLGFARANNAAARVAKGDILLFLNNDTVTDTPFVPVVEDLFSAHPKVGVAGPGLRFSDGSFQLSAGALPTFWREIGDKFVYGLLDRNVAPVHRLMAQRYSREREVGWVTGAALFIRSEVFKDLGGFDERMFMFFEDKDLCARVRAAGWSIRYTPRSSLIHLKGGSSGTKSGVVATEYRRSQVQYYAKHRPRSEQRLLRLYLECSGKAPR